MDWISQHWLIVLSLVLSAVGIWWLMPRAEMRSRPFGFLLAFVGVGLLASQLHLAAGPHTEGFLFLVFATLALVCSVLMITSRNPVYSALWFALVTLAVCGLFLLQSAPFLAAATIIVYAGAIVVTFVFVIMLAQQSGATVYDQRSRQPLVATLAAFILLGALLSTFEPWHQAQASDSPTTAVSDFNPLSRPAADEPLGTMHGLGRSLFGDYLFAVELAGTLLLIAMIGAVVMAPQTLQGYVMISDAERYLAVGAMLFVLGAIGFLTRRNLIVMVLSVELMLHGVSLTLVTFGQMHHSLEGQAFTIFILTVAASEAGLALSLILALYQNSKSLDVELWDNLREADLPPAYDEADADEPPAEQPERWYFPSLTPAGRSPSMRGPLPPDDISNTLLRDWESRMVDDDLPEPELIPPTANK